MTDVMVLISMCFVVAGVLMFLLSQQQINRLQGKFNDAIIRELDRIEANK